MQSYNQLNNLYQPGPQREMGAQAERMRAMEEVTAKSMDQILWASSQSSALSKLKVFSSMAKTVNDQQ